MKIGGTILIERPVGDVFDFVADTRNEPLYNPRMRSVERTSSGPIGVGSRFRCLAAGWGQVAPMTVELTAYDRPHRLASLTRLANMRIEGSLTFDTVPGGTLMSWRWDVIPQGSMRHLGLLLRWAGNRQERAIWTGLKRLLEGKTAA